VQENCITFGTHHSYCRSPWEEEDSEADLEAILLADPILRCG